MVANDPTYGRMMLPELEKCDNFAASDGLEELLETLDKQMANQMMKGVPTLCASNTTKRAGKRSTVSEK